MPAPADLTWRLLTPVSSTGAVAIIGLEARDERALDDSLARLGLGPLGIGQLFLRPLSAHDRGVVARWSETSVQLMPHGGAAVVREVLARLAGAGIPPAATLDPAATYPEAPDHLSALLLHALSVAASPKAIELLLEQPARWKGPALSAGAAPAVLDRLIHPALVVALGPSNVGKSTLLNALAGRTVSIVADEPGTTRDHVGAALDLGGVVVRYVDTPGRRRTGDPIEAEAQRLSMQVVEKADLVLLMGDRSQPPPPTDQRPILRVALRADLGEPSWPFDCAVSATTGRGLPELVTLIRETLVPRAALEDPRPWRFWESLGMEYRPAGP